MKALLGADQQGAAVNIDIPRLIESKLLIQAMSGGGKSYAVRGLLERTHGEIQHLIIDLEGEFRSLREKFNYVLVGPGGDLPADPRSAELLAIKLLELRADTILDLSELKLDLSGSHGRGMGPLPMYVSLLLQGLMEAPKKLWHPLMVLIDEAQILAPQDSITAASEKIRDLARRGRKREFVLVPAIQRLSMFDKNVAAECQNKLIGLTTLDTDVKRAADDLGFARKDATPKLRDLEPGEFFAFGPAISRTVTKVRLAKVQTKHGKEARKAAARAAAPTGKIKQVLAKLADLPQEAEEDLRDRDAMKARIRELERALKEKSGITPAEKAQLVQQAYEKGKTEVLRTMSTMKNAFKSKLQELGALVDRIPEAAAPAAARDPDRSLVHTNVRPPTNPPQPLTAKAAAPTRVSNATPAVGIGDAFKWGQCERRILGFLLMKAGQVVTKIQVGVMTGYSQSGSFQKALTNLASVGLISRIDGKLTLTPGAEGEARAIVGDETSSKLEDWIRKLGPCERKVYELCLGEPSSTWSKEEIGQITGYSMSGSFQKVLTDLSTLGLIKRHPQGRIGLNPDVVEFA